MEHRDWSATAEGGKSAIKRALRKIDVDEPIKGVIRALVPDTGRYRVHASGYFDADGAAKYSFAVYPLPEEEPVE